MPTIDISIDHWILLVSICPVFEDNLTAANGGPTWTEQGSSRDESSGDGFPSLPKLQLDVVRPGKYITMPQFRLFITSVTTVLEIFENLVDDASFSRITHVLNGDNDSPSRVPVENLQQLQIGVENLAYPKLAALKKASKLTPRYACSSSRPESRPNQAVDALVACLTGLERKIRDDFKRADYPRIQRAIMDFNRVVCSLFQNHLGETAGAGTHRLNDKELAIIQAAGKYNSSFSTLFQLLVKNMPCSKEHSAWVHMSGFGLRQLDVVIATCKDSQQIRRATCRSSAQEVPPTPREVRASCQSRTGPDYSDHFHFAFDENALWHDLQPVLNVHQSSRDPTAETHSQTTLRELLESGGVRNQYNELCEFEKEDQKSIELLLAYSLLCLRGTSWLQACVGVDEIISFPSPDSEDLLSRWRPHLPCTLGEKAQICDEIDQIRAFGILLMELESGLRATSLPELDFEPDYENPRAGPTKDAVLERMLAEWARKVDDGYFRVASACLDFPNRAELMLPFLGEHADKIGDENLEKLKRTAAIFKHVVMPLREILEKRHSNVFQLFNNFSVHTAEHRDEELDFFDDASTDGSQSTNKSSSDERRYAINFLNGLKIGINDIQFKAGASRGTRTKIAIIDTGIDLDDVFFKDKIDEGRIVDKMGFTSNEPKGTPDDVQDQNGHGSIVARVLLQNAPAAAVYIAKVSDKLTIPSSHVPWVAEAINWAISKDVDIISMSFGLSERQTIIDQALARRSSLGRPVIFAAASNRGQGGLGRPTYPARLSSVLCISACDGNGNRAKFNPPRVRNSANYTTLGVQIQSRWRGKDVVRSGTSFATPLAVAMVANCLEFVRHHPSLRGMCDFYHTYEGVEGLMDRMAWQTDDQYDFVDAKRLWNGKNGDDEIARLFDAAKD